MKDEMAKGQNNQTRRSARELLSLQSVEDLEKTKAKREQFLARLKKQYGYTNDKAVDELERLLKMFYTTNRSLRIHRKHTNFKHPNAAA
jgi:hypothetical protein